MGIDVGLDFGTATTCVAVLDPASLVPTVVEIRRDADFIASQVWFDRRSDMPSLVDAPSAASRLPRAIYRDARELYGHYWRRRVEAKSSFTAWHEWQRSGNESDMLLEYFKPELTAPEESETVVVDYAVKSEYFPEREYEEVRALWPILRVMATPSPATSDFVLGAAALIREAASAVVRASGELISRLALGLPSDRDGEIWKRGCSTRLEAVAAARIAADLGAPDFEVCFLPESLAAAFGLHLDVVGPSATVVVVDVGAGTTDLSCMVMKRTSGGYWTVERELGRASIPFAGRNINDGIYKHLCRGVLRRVCGHLDRRSAQQLVLDQIERIKQRLGWEEEQFAVDMNAVSAVPPAMSEFDPLILEMKKTFHFPLSLEELASTVLPRQGSWWSTVRSFLEEMAVVAVSHGQSIAAIEVVGGGARCPLFVEGVRDIAIDVFEGAVPVSYRDSGTAMQTVVARGLALAARA